MDATKKGDEICSTAKQTDEEGAWQQFEKLVRKEGASGFLMSPATKKHYESRHVSSINVDLRRRPADLRSRMPVVSGSSGSGKTWFMIHCKAPHEFGVYLTVDDIERDGPWDDSAWGTREYDRQAKKAKQEEGESKDSNPRESFEAERSEALVEAMSKAISLRLTKEALALLKQEEDEDKLHPLLCVVDEVGMAPQLLGALCLAREALEKSLQTTLQLARLECNFVVGGRGANSALLQPGCRPSTFNLIAMDN